MDNSSLAPEVESNVHSSTALAVLSIFALRVESRRSQPPMLTPRKKSGQGVPTADVCEVLAVAAVPDALASLVPTDGL